MSLSGNAGLTPLLTHKQCRRVRPTLTYNSERVDDGCDDEIGTDEVHDEDDSVERLGARSTRREQYGRQQKQVAGRADEGSDAEHCNVHDGELRVDL